MDAKYLLTCSIKPEISRNCNLHFLKRIDMWRCKNVGDLSFLILGRYSKKLETIDLNHCKNVSNDGLKALIEGCLKLKSLDCRGTNVSESFVKIAREKNNIRNGYI